MGPSQVARKHRASYPRRSEAPSRVAPARSSRPDPPDRTPYGDRSRSLSGSKGAWGQSPQKKNNTPPSCPSQLTFDLPVQIYRGTGYFDNFRWSDLLCSPSSRAACEMLPPQSVSTRLMCSHSARASEATLGSRELGRIAGVCLARSNAAMMSSTSAGLVR